MLERSRSSIFCFALFCLFVNLSFAHVCLLYPPQRGGYDVSTPASYSCFQPTAPCGTVEPTEPTFQIEGGKTFNVLLQQNLNHYNPGFPGFIDIGYSVGTNQTSDADFTLLRRISDYWPHFQATQTNFSIPITVPDIDCSWCTLQVRYHPNKPTEPIFHNCADISIVPTTLENPGGTYLGIIKAGPDSAASENESSFATLDPITGQVDRLIVTSSHIGQRDMETNQRKPIFYAANGMLAPAIEGGLVFLGYSANTPTDYPAVSTLYHYSAGHDNMTSLDLEFPTGIAQFDAIVATFSDTPAPHFIVGQTEDPSTGTYTLSVFWIWKNGTISEAIATSSPDQTYVNFLWATYSPCAGNGGQIYLLVGDENSLTALNVKLFTFDISTSSVSSVLVDNSMYTISSINAWPEGDCKNLYTVSPGLVEEKESERVWNLVSVDPVTGDVSNPVAVSEPGEYKPYYGGAVYGKATNSNNQMTYLFRRQIDSSFEIKLINLQTRTVDATASVNLGVNSLASLSSIVYLP